MNRTFTNNTIRYFLGSSANIDREFEIIQVDSIRVNHNSLMFINKPGIDLETIDKSIDCVILLDESYPETFSYRNDFIRVKNPKFKFCQIVERYNLKSRLQINHDQTKHDVYQGVSCKEYIIGDNCQIDPGVYIGGTDFSPVLGDSRDQMIQFPQMGGVMIGDNVVIKYSSIIGKGTFDWTYIGNNTMIDFGCQIGHNCSIGDSCIIAAGTIIGGSTTIGDQCTIGIGAKIRNGLKIGNNVSIGMGSVVIRDIPDNSVVVGNPARIINHVPIFNERGLI